MASSVHFMPKCSTAGNGKGILQRGKFLWNYWSAFQKSSRIDQIDSFTSELLEKKSLKWGIERELVLQINTIPKQNFFNGFNTAARSFSQDLESICQPDLCIDIRTLTQDQLDNILVGILEVENERDFAYIIKQCILYRLLPSNEMLTKALEFLAANRGAVTIDSVSAVCKDINEQFYRNNAQLLPYKSMALWRTGNAELALRTIVEGYEATTHRSLGRRSLRELFRTIASETIGAKSEAVLVSVVKVAECINKDFKEIFPLACVWRNTFTSLWFSDQQLSTELFNKFEMLRILISKRSSTLCYALLYHHDVDAVHRLIELFLRNNSKEASSNCLKMLFNYQYWRQDLRACSEIMQYSLDINLPLPEAETQKLLDLLLNRPAEFYKRVPITPCDKFQYKF